MWGGGTGVILVYRCCMLFLSRVLRADLCRDGVIDLCVEILEFFLTWS